MGFLDKAFKMQKDQEYKHIDLVSIYQEAFETVIKQKTKIQL